MNFSVACFGSAFIDVYLQSPDFKVVRSDSSPTGKDLSQVYGGKLKVSKMAITTGGGATNVCVGLERLGLQTAAVCAVGDDHWGLFVRKDLKREGVSLLYVQQVDEPTSYSTILVAPDGGRSALVYRGASSQLAWQKVAWDKLDPDWFYLSSLGGDFNLLTKIIRNAQERKIRVAFNPGSQEIGSLNKLKPFLAYIEVLLVNLQEAAKLTEHLPKNKEEIFKDLVKLNIPVIAVTEGRGGANLIVKKKVTHLPAIKVEAVEETGAGDAFASGFVAGIIQGHKPEVALKMGLSNGASVTTAFGPKAGLLFTPDMNKWLKK